MVECSRVEVSVQASSSEPAIQPIVDHAPACHTNTCTHTRHHSEITRRSKEGAAVLVARDRITAALLQTTLSVLSTCDLVA